MSIFLKRAYDPVQSGDGARILVDRLWPRGISKEKLAVQDWLKDSAPSNSLRKRFHQDEINWSQFRRSYLAELKAHRDTLRSLAQQSRRQTVTLIYSASTPNHNNAVVLRQYLRMLGGE